MPLNPSCIREYVHLEFVLILFLEFLFREVPIRLISM
jgi:hypothetical protein